MSAEHVSGAQASAPGALLILGAEPALLGPPRRLVLAPPDFDPWAAWLGLLGQSPAARWRGPAPLALAAAGRSLGEDETVYLLSPVRAEAGRISAEAPWPPGQQRELLAELEESFEDEALSLCAGELGPTLCLAEEVPGPPIVLAEPLAGRALSDLPGGPSALLERVVAASARLCARRGKPRGATHLFPHAPATRLAMAPLREAWPGLGPVSFVGGALARALATLLGGTHWAALPEGALALGRERCAKSALVVVVEAAPLSAAQLATLSELPRLAVASRPEPGPEGIEVRLAHRGPALGDVGPDLLRAFALGVGPA